VSSSHELSGLNSGYVGQLLEQYLDNPEGVDPAWRDFFEGADVYVLAALPGLMGLPGLSD
jgi:2-oxoglutarate dehydrogenase complex dehydrogenase (E1) component-like enzyme